MRYRGRWYGEREDRVTVYNPANEKQYAEILVKYQYWYTDDTYDSPGDYDEWVESWDVESVYDDDDLDGTNTNDAWLTDELIENSIH